MRRVFLAVLLLFCAGCGDDTPTTPSTTPANSTERFDSIINVRESKFYPFSVGSNGTTTVNLASLSPLNRLGVVNATVEIGWGKSIKDEDGNVVRCELARVIQTTPGLAAQSAQARRTTYFPAAGTWQHKAPVDVGMDAAKLKEAVGKCNAAYSSGNGQLRPLFINVGHTNLHYGNIITYMRMMGLKPPSS